MITSYSHHDPKMREIEAKSDGWRIFSVTKKFCLLFGYNSVNRYNHDSDWSNEGTNETMWYVSIKTQNQENTKVKFTNNHEFHVTTNSVKTLPKSYFFIFYLPSLNSNFNRSEIFQNASRHKLCHGISWQNFCWHNFRSWHALISCLIMVNIGV